MENITKNIDNNALVTVITCSYNNFINFYKTIDSVLNQNYKNVQYIISDDGSNDFNEDSIKEYIDRHNKNSYEILIIHNKKNLGTVKNINNAYKNAKGKYIINLSTNDIFYNENVITDIVGKIEKEDATALVSSRIMYDENLVIKDIIPNRSYENDIKKLNSKIKKYKKFIMNFIYGMCSGSVLCVKKDYIEKIGYYDEKYFLMEDAPFFADLLYNEKVLLATDIVSIYYDGAGVSTGTKKANEKFEKDLNKFLTEKCIEHIDEFNFFEKRRILYRKYRHEINENNKLERIKLMIKYLLEAIYFKFFNK